MKERGDDEMTVLLGVVADFFAEEEPGCRQACVSDLRTSA